MKWLGVSLLVAAFVNIFASTELQPPETCESDDEACVAAQGQAMLQKRSDRTQESMDIMEDSMAGTMVYEYAGSKISIAADSDVALTGKGVWIITVEKGCTDDDVKKMAEHMPAGSKATYSGHPDEGGLCTFMMEGTKSMVETELETHTWPSPPVVSADFPISAIPDLDKTEDDGAFLLETNASAGPPASWGLDRVDDRGGLDSSYTNTGTYPKQGSGVHVYVLDTGVLTTHQDFGGRAKPAFDVFYNKGKECSPSDTNCAIDRQGHGTHCRNNWWLNVWGCQADQPVRREGPLGPRQWLACGHHPGG
jgi:hypothetical protein